MNRRRKAVLCIILLSAATFGVLAGCGIIGEKYTTIEWSASYFEKYYPRWMDDFCRAHSEENVRISFRAMVADASQKVYTMLISHTLSDVIVVGNATEALLLENDALEPIPQGYLNRDDFMPIGLAVHTYPDGTLAAIPSGVGIRPFMYFNVEHLKEVGTSEKEAPEGYGEYHKWASRFMKWKLGDGEIVSGRLPEGEVGKAALVRRPLLLQRGHVPSSYPFILAYLDPTPDEDGKSDNSLDDFLGGPPKGRPFRFDTPEFIRGLTEWQDFFIQEDGAIADGETGRIYGLTAGNYSSCEAGNWIFGEVYSVSMQVTSLPHADGKPLKLYMNVGSYGVSKESRNKELAMEFAKYISGTERELDGYYGHGYLPVRFSAWERIASDDVEDAAIRERFLAEFAQGHEDFVGQPRIKRTYHDRMEIYAYVALGKDETISQCFSGGEGAGGEVLAGDAGRGEEEPEEGVATGLAAKYDLRLRALAQSIAEMTGQEVTVKLQGTPPDVLGIRSVVGRSPVDVYIPLLESGVYVPVHRLWARLQGEVLRRAQQFVTVADESERMTPEEAAKWCQQEAEAIVAGTK